MAHVIIGTAGHIDHGKTALVKALTGVDTDTLPEEQARGVTIDIGFAYWKDNVTIIDVPGHERFVKNMVTGVSTIDLAILVVAADDGVMPQTREHLGILNLLGVPRGIVALTKADLVEEDWLELVEEELHELFEDTFLKDAPIVPVSSITGQGIDDLRTLVEAEIEQVATRPDRGVFRLPVDRAFSVQGFGTVVTGTVLSGAVKPRDELELLPSGDSVRVRGVQTHGQEVAEAHVGARAAINLSGIEMEDVARGDILAQPGYFKSTYMIDVRLHLLPDAPSVVKNRTRVHLHLGPREVLARIVLLESDELPPGESQLVQLRLEEPGVVARGDRFVVRRYSPVQTLGGGVVLDTQPVKHRRFRQDVIESLYELEQDDPTEVIRARLKSAGLQARLVSDLAADMGLSSEDVSARLAELVDREEAISFTQAGKKWFAHADQWANLKAGIREAMQVFHTENPLLLGVRRAELFSRVAGRPERAFFDFGVEVLLEDGILKTQEALLCLSDHTIQLSSEQTAVRDLILNALKVGGTAPTDLRELPEALGQDAQMIRDVATALQATGDVVRLDDTILFYPEVIRDVESRLVSHLEQHGEIDVATFRNLVNTTRKFAVPLLNYFDTQNVTMRQGDVRKLNRN